MKPPGDYLPLGGRPNGGHEELKGELLPGNVVVFCPGGLPEALAITIGLTLTRPLTVPVRAGDLFGFERPARAAVYWSTRAESAERVAGGIWADVLTWCTGKSHRVDMTLLVLRIVLRISTPSRTDATPAYYKVKPR